MGDILNVNIYIFDQRSSKRLINCQSQRKQQQKRRWRTISVHLPTKVKSKNGQIIMCSHSRTICSALIFAWSDGCLRGAKLSRKKVKIVEDCGATNDRFIFNIFFDCSFYSLFNVYTFFLLSSTRFQSLFWLLIDITVFLNSTSC